MSQDLKLTYRILLAMLLLAELLALTGVIEAPHALFMAELSVANAGTYALFVVVLYAFSRPPRKEARAVVAVGAALAVLAAYRELPSLPLRPVTDWLFIAAAGIGATAIVAWVLRLTRRTGEAALTRDLLAASGLAPLADPTVSAYLNLTLAIQPAAFDLGAYRFDAMLGFQPSASLALVAEHLPWFMALLTAAYMFQPYGISLLYALQRVAPRPQPVSIVAFQAVTALLSALLFYHLYPVTGPTYAFGAAFPAWLPDAAQLGDVSSLVPRGARNGLPSMHFAWALALWLGACCLGIRWLRALFAAWLGLTVLSTLALGEHYLVDLAVAVPLTVGILALCALGSPWSRERARAVWVGLGLTIAWVLVLRFGSRWLLAAPGALTWLAMGGTVLASAMVYRPLERTLLAHPRPAPAPQTERAQPYAALGLELRYVALMFVLSGLAALIYQVVFTKALALTFGSQAAATSTVLAVYMGGMALGAWLGGRIAGERSDALRLYALCEFGIGAYCAATPWVFQAVQETYVALAAGVSPDAGTLTALRVLLGASALMLPTILMGATLPILARYCESRAPSLGSSVALLYGANTVGAALGALLSGYIILPALGVAKSTFLTAALNFAAVWLALRLRARGQPPWPTADAATPVPPLGEAPVPRLGGLALAILGVGGIVTLALEVNYVHLLAVVAGNSAYAFSLMLFTFLLGLAAGAELARRLLAHALPLPLALAWFEFALAAVILAGVWLWDGLPAYFASFETHPLARGFGAREVVRGLACFVAMFPPAVMIGAIYPLAMEMIGRANPRRPIAALGRAAALNTAGNVVGVLAAGFWLLPQLGALRSIQVLAGLCFALGAIALAWTGLRSRAPAWAPAAAVIALLAAQPRALDYTALASGANVYFAAQGYGPAIDHAESADGGLTIVTAPGVPGREALRVLLTNGKFQGTNDLGGEGVAQSGFALAPLLHTAARERALVIGYGTGMTARVLHDAGFRALDIVELSADVVRLADRHFRDVNGGVTSRPGVRTFLTDGRNFLLLQEGAYDVISMELTSIWFAGAGSLYNREFYALARRRLAPDGALQQWVQLHNLRPEDLLYILGSVRAEFRFVWLYLIGGQGVIVAANSPAAGPQPAHLETIERTEALGPFLRLHGGTARRLGETRLLDPGATDRLLSALKSPPGHWVSTDDNLYLEYATPRGNVLDGRDSFARNIEMIRTQSAAKADARTVRETANGLAPALPRPVQRREFAAGGTP